MIVFIAATSPLSLSNYSTPTLSMALAQAVTRQLHERLRSGTIARKKRLLRG
ncbi:MAG TPA: hypothetical protein VJS12_15740 [Steroidobacteraceae bacterium]|nr:hypothetical protein [Steroidobacteraceae bacterium]